MNDSKRPLPATILLGMFALLAFVPGPANGQTYSAQATERTFPETGKTVSGRFLEYWEANGGLPQQGYPISEEMQEVSDTDGKTYTVQYFERAVFEMHPENQPPNDVLLSLLGVFLSNQKYPAGAPNQSPNNEAGSRLFAETGKRVGGVFLDYWSKNGGLAQQGYPISDEFNEVSALDGKTYRVQYFERAVFEYHPENQPPYDVLLSQLGTFRYRARYLQPAPTPIPPTPTPSAAEPSPTPSTGAIPQPPEYAAVRAKFENLTPEQWSAAGYNIPAHPGCDSGIGYIVRNQAIWEDAYRNGKVDPQNPSNVLLNGKRDRIIGLLWLSGDTTKPPPVLFDRPMGQGQSNGEQVYLFFSYFKPNGHVLFAMYDPDNPCRR